MMDLDKLIEFLVVTDQVDSNFGLKEKCPVCGKSMDKIDDIEPIYYCPGCQTIINKEKSNMHILKKI